MRRLNVKLSLILVAAAAVLAGGMYWIHEVQTRRNAGALLRQADAAEKSGDRTKTLEYLDRYLTYAPDDVATLIRYGEMLASDPHRTEAAVNTFEKVLIRSPDRTDIRLRLVDLYLGQGDLREAYKTSPTVSAELATRVAGGGARPEYASALAHLNLFKDNADGNVLLRKGRCEQGLGHFVEAARYYESARKQAPKPVEAYRRLAYLLRFYAFQPSDKVDPLSTWPPANRVKTADQIIEEMVKQNGQSAAAYLGRSFYREHYVANLAGAAEDAFHALRLAPDDLDAIYTAARFKAAMGASGLAEARDILHHGLDLHPNAYRLYERLSEIERAAGKPDNAIACLKRGLERMPEQVDLTWQLADTLLSTGKMEEAAETIRRLGKMPLFNPSLWELLQARWEMNEQARKPQGQDWHKAASDLERAAAALVTRTATEPYAKEAYLHLGLCYDYLKDLDRRLDSFRSAVAIRSPRFEAEARAGLAAALVAVSKATGKISEAKVREAVEEYRKVLALQSTPAAAAAKSLSSLYVDFAPFLASRNKLEDALTVAEQAEAGRMIPPDRCALLQADCYLRGRQPEKVVPFCQKAVQHAPGDPTTLQVATVLALRARKQGDAERYLEQLIKLEAKFPHAAANARRVLAQLKATRGGPGKLDEALRSLETDGSGSQTVEDRRTRAEISSLFPSRERRQEAITLLEGLVKEDKATVVDRIRLCQLYESFGSRDRAHALTQGLMSAGLKDPNDLWSLAQILIRYNEPDEAQKWVDQLEKLVPGSREVVEMRARLLVARNKKQDAARLVEAFAQSQPIQLLPAARLLQDLGLPEAAEPLYKRYYDQFEDKDSRAPFILADFLVRQGRLKEALDFCESSWQKLPARLAALETIQVLNLASPADEVSCQRVATWVKEASSKDPKESTFPFALAYIETAMGHSEKAEQLYRQILQQEKTNGITLEPGRKSAILNNLAWLLLFKKGREPEALELVDSALKLESQESPNPDLVDTRGLTYLRLGRVPDAIRDLEDVVTRNPVAEKYFHLAQAYHAAGKNENAREAFKKARDLGLKVESLHPLERIYYGPLADDLTKS
jgi:tetratricopeptide (TPR) repeat protein